MTALPSHLGSMSSGKAETPRPYCPYTENSALKLFLNIFFPSFLTVFHNCFDWMVCSEVSSGTGLGLVWPSSGFTRTNGKTSTEYFILANIFRARKRSFYSCQLTKHSFYPSLLGNLLIRPSLERIADSLRAAGSFT